MDENFKKFKKKVWIDILIRCGIIALLVAFIAVDAVLLPCKLYGINLLWVFYVLIGLGGFALGGGISFLILRTNDKAIAKRLDSDLNLSERVQTAYIFGNQKSDMLDLQRENTVSTLASIPAKALPLKSLLVSVLCAVVALSVGVAVPVMAVTVPPVLAQENVLPPDERPRPVTDWEWKALDDLIAYVQDSKKADTDSKNAMLTELNGLRNLLLSGVSQSSLTIFVSNTANQISNGVKLANDKYPTEIDANGNIKPAPQAQANSEEAAYVVTRLYEIFDLSTPSDGDNPKDEPIEEKPDDGNNDDAPTLGGIDLNGTPFFDPDKGYVLCGEVRKEYYEKVQQAFADGIISREEWELIMVYYFADLGVNDDD